MPGNTAGTCALLDDPMMMYVEMNFGSIMLNLDENDDISEPSCCADVV